MQTYPEIRKIVAPLIDEGMIIGLRAHRLSVDLEDREVTANVFQLMTMMDSTVTLVADLQEVVTVHHPACDTGQDGVEPAYDETFTYNLLRVSPDFPEAITSSVGLVWGPIKHIDILSQSIEVRSNEGSSMSERFAGIQFTLDERMMGGKVFCYRIVQKSGSDRLMVQQVQDPSDLGDLTVVERIPEVEQAAS